MTLTHQTQLRTSKHFFAGLLCVVSVVVYILVFLKNAWVGDDAYILFRSLEQLLDGNGPRWNPHERVQVFTSPLWYGLLGLMGYIHRDHYLNSILLSLVCNAVVLWQLFRLLPGTANRVLALLLLMFSQAYFDFTSSGLENPLAYALLASIARYYLLEDLAAPVRQFRLLLMAGLLLITRHDLALLVLPLLIHTTRQPAMTGTANRAQQLILLLAPLAIWTLFALVYYGFAFPNTAYAKLAAVVPRSALLQHGLMYFQTSILRDLPSLFILASGMIAGIIANRNTRYLAAGIALHLLYVLWIGGDFMRGRFFSWDVLCCVILLLRTPMPTTPAWRVLINTRCLLATIAMLAGTALWAPPLLTPIVWGTPSFGAPDSAHGITQERHFFFRFTSLARYLKKGDAILNEHGWCVDSLQQHKQRLPVTSGNTMGFRGFCLGTDSIVVDMLGITDPLLARMPKSPSQKNWRPGHFYRLLPDNYCNSVLHNENRMTDPLLHDYYTALRLLTQSEDLLSPERLAAIWHFNSGADSAVRQQIHTQLLLQAESSGKAGQAEARRDCPAVELPAEVIEHLKNAEL